jgi:hypothetical protein
VFSVKFIAEAGHEETCTVSVTAAALHAAAESVAKVCVGEEIAGEAALLPLALAKVLEYRREALSICRLVLTAHPAVTQLIGSSGRQSPPFWERTWARSPVPT